MQIIGGPWIAAKRIFKNPDVENIEIPARGFWGLITKGIEYHSSMHRFVDIWRNYIESRIIK